jgi:hypothetical protein
LRGRWTIADDSGRVWQPYVRANLWRDWGAQATTTFSGADLVPLLEQARAGWDRIESRGIPKSGEP